MRNELHNVPPAPKHQPLDRAAIERHAHRLQKQPAARSLAAKLPSGVIVRIQRDGRISTL